MAMNGFGSGTSSGGMMGDYKEELNLRILPATGAKKPFGPDNLPITAPPAALPADTPPWAQSMLGKLDSIFNELVRQNTASIPKVRSASVDQNGQTLDFSVLGFADRLMLENLGPNTVWFNFDQSGPSVAPSTGDSSFQLPANSTFSPSLCKFTKIGLKCAAGQTATVCAVGFRSVAGNQQGVIS